MNFESPQRAENENVKIAKILRVSEEPPIFFGNDSVTRVRTALNIMRNLQSSEGRKNQALHTLRAEGIEYDPELDQSNPEIMENLLHRRAQSKIGEDTRQHIEAEEQARLAEEDRIRKKIAQETHQAMATEQWKPEEKPKGFLGKIRGMLG